MNALLIYNENVPLLLKYDFEEQLGVAVSFRFKEEMQLPSFSMDKKMSDFLLRDEIEVKEYDVIFIPYSLSDESYMEFLGLRLAHHIRLTKDFKNIQTPIVFYGFDSSWEINKLTNLGQILFTRNIFSTCKISIAAFKAQAVYILDDIGKGLFTDDSFIKEVASKLSINPPGNYQTHHSIDNELTLLRWATYLGCENKVEEVKSRLSNGLYFKYFNAKYPIGLPEVGLKYNINKNGKILLIDDEVKKGWAAFYTEFFKLSPGVKFDALEIDFKEVEQDLIINKAVEKVIDFDADIVLLDLRLCDVDFDEGTKVDNLTGYQILKKIKEINRGIQVIITTASNKIWNYEATNSAGADGYLIKRGDSDVALDLKHLKEYADKMIDRARFLKPINREFYELCEKLNGTRMELVANRGFWEELKRQLEISNRLFNDAVDSLDFAYAYLALFKNLEIINENFVNLEDSIWKLDGGADLNRYRWNTDAKEYDCDNSGFGNNVPSTFEKIAGLCVQILGWRLIDLESLYYFIRVRNCFVHPASSKLTDKVTFELNRINTFEGFCNLHGKLLKIIHGLILKGL